MTRTHLTLPRENGRVARSSLPRPPRAQRLLVGMIVGAAPLVTRVAIADLPPPSGQKQVGYSFAVRQIPANTDRVLFAYPCSGSFGAPKAEQAKIEDGRPISVGRRGGGCPIYSIAKSKYDEFMKSYTPSTTSMDPALDTLTASAVKCMGGPTPSFYLASTDTRGSIDETFKVTALDATTCTLAIDVPPATTAATASSSPPPARESAPLKKSSCAMAAGSHSSGAALLGLIMVATAWMVRLRRSSRDCSPSANDRFDGEALPPGSTRITLSAREDLEHDWTAND